MEPLKTNSLVASLQQNIKPRWWTDTITFLWQSSYVATSFFSLFCIKLLPLALESCQKDRKNINNKQHYKSKNIFPEGPKIISFSVLYCWHVYCLDLHFVKLLHSCIHLSGWRAMVYKCRIRVTHLIVLPSLQHNLSKHFCWAQFSPLIFSACLTRIFSNSAWKKNS